MVEKDIRKVVVVIHNIMVMSIAINVVSATTSSASPYDKVIPWRTDQFMKCVSIMIPRFNHLKKNKRSYVKTHKKLKRKNSKYKT